MIDAMDYLIINGAYGVSWIYQIATYDEYTDPDFCHQN